MPQKCHSKERSNEESLSPGAKILRSAQNDWLWATFEATPRIDGRWVDHIRLKPAIVIGLIAGLFSLACIVGTEPSPTRFEAPTSVRPPTPSEIVTLKAAVRFLATVDVAATRVAAIRASIRGTPTPTVKPNITPILPPTSVLRTRVVITEPTPTPTKRSPRTERIPRTISISYAGNNDLILGPLDLADGVVILKASHLGQGEFSVLLFGESEGGALLIDTVGAYKGVRGASVSFKNQTGLVPGAHRIEVRADGEWNINIGQEYPTDQTDARVPPFTLGEQSGDAVERWVGLSRGEFVIRASHLGTEEFDVRLINADGGAEVVVVDKTGIFEGERSLNVGSASSAADLTPGIYAVVVRADGAWEISIQP